MSYFYVPKESDAAQRSHIVKPHTGLTVCGWNCEEMSERYKPATDLRQSDTLCRRCLYYLGKLLDHEGTAAVPLQVHKTIVQQLEKRTKDET